MLGAGLACAALISSASPAQAFHIPGADYSGFATGGGSISFSISSDGSSVTNLTLNGPLEANDCTTGSAHYSQPIPITNNTFDNGEVNGGFPNPRGAYGHFNLAGSNFLTPCRVTGTWSAITSASPNGSAECIQAQAQVKKAKRALRKAKKSGSKKKIDKAGRKWARARARRDQFCI